MITNYKFKNIGEILSCFIDKRYELYKLRKQSIIKQLENDLDELKIECRFIRLVVDDKIVLFKRDDEDIINDLKNNNFNMKDNSYDYLLGIKISKFTQNNVGKLEEKIKE